MNRAGQVGEPPYGFEQAPRCTATSKRSGLPCRAPRVRGWNVCRFHGARGGAPVGERNGMYRHGESTNSARTERHKFAELMREARAGLALAR